ncbi:MAG: HigA family addiction module antitoxin [Pseudomonadota bacterium]
MKTVMNAPPHPGAILREDVLPELGLTVAGAARQLRVSRAMLSRILSGPAGISAETALRMEKWLGSPSAESWLRLQMAYDLWYVAKHPRKVAKMIERIRLRARKFELPSGWKESAELIREDRRW